MDLMFLEPLSFIFVLSYDYYLTTPIILLTEN